MKLSDRVTAAADVMSRQVGDETVILDLASGTYFGLDSVGARMWRALTETRGTEGTQGRTLAEACDLLLAELEVSRDVLERDVLALAERLLEQKLLQVT